MGRREELAAKKDDELLCMCRDDGLAFEVFCERVLKSLYGYSVLVCRELRVPPDLAEDAVHDALLKLMRLLAGDGSAVVTYPRTYLKRAIHRHLITSKRKRSGKAISIEALEMEPCWNDPEADEELEELQRLLGLMKPEEADLLERAYRDGQSHETIAEDLGITVAAASKRIQRALERLYAIVENHGVRLKLGGED